MINTYTLSNIKKIITSILIISISILLPYFDLDYSKEHFLKNNKWLFLPLIFSMLYLLIDLEYSNLYNDIIWSIGGTFIIAKIFLPHNTLSDIYVKN